MKWLIILLLLIIVVSMLALKYRKHIQTGLYMWRMFRQMRQINKPVEKKIENPPSEKNANLIRCARCGKWIAASSALNLRSNTSYCSTACMEKASRIESLVDKG